MVWFRVLAVATMLAVAAPSSSFAAPKTNEAFVKDTREYLTRLGTFGFSGVVLVEENGSLVLSDGYGFADRENKVKWTSRTISDIGSITKQFTAAAILLLEQGGTLAVTDSLSRFSSPRRSPRCARSSSMPPTGRARTSPTSHRRCPRRSFAMAS